MSDSASPTLEHETVLRPESTFSWESLRQIWRFRELLWILGMRDVRVRYKQAVLGVMWALLQPLVQMIIFTVLFNRFAGIHSDSSVPYPVFCFSGLVVWTLFSSGLSQASNSLIESASLVTKVYFPRAVIPMGAVVAAMVDFLVALVPLVALMAFYGVGFHWTALLLLPIAAVAALCAIALGIWASAINVHYRDVRYALPFFIQILVYVTPVFYPSSLVPERYRGLLALNPMAAVVDSFRAALFGQPLPLMRLGIASGTALMVTLLGLVWFRRIERTFADRI